MKANHRDDDLFRDTTMTFGEHLEELRSCLIKAVLSLVVGFLFGLYVGEWVVHRIQDPLEAALKSYHLDQAVTRFKNELAERKKRGENIPAELEDDKNLERLVFEGNLLFQEVYLSPAQVFEELKKRYPEQFGAVTLPPADASKQLSRDDMLRVFLWHPAEDDERIKVESLSGPEPFMIYIKASLITGFVVASPFIFYFVWSFVAAGLYPTEKKYVHIFLPFSIALFLAGVALAYFLVFPPVLNFFMSYNKSLGQSPHPRISEWLSFVLTLPLAFGLSFQLPLVMLFLERIGVFTVHSYLSKWRIAILTMAIASMVLSPGGDPYSMLFMLGPMIFLYFGGIALCKWMPSRRSQFAIEPVG